MSWLMCFILAPFLAFAQDAKPPEQAPMKVPGFQQAKEQLGKRFFDEKNIVTLKGKVLEMEKIGRPEGRMTGIHFTFEADKKTYDVHLGPEWYVEKIGLKLKAGDELEVKGSLVQFRDKAKVIATSVKSGDHLFELRDASGAPAWRGSETVPQ